MSIEININRRNTHSFILARPSSIALIPVTATKTASGGTQRADAPPRETQTFRLIEQTTTSGNAPGRLPASDGHQTRVSWQLLGEWDAVMAIGDHWTDPKSGAGYKVEELLPYNGYERRARVVAYGD
jgi:hypothetical protein